MKTILVFCNVVFFNLFAFAQPETELVKKIKAKLDKVMDYKANGKMKIDVSFINAPESNVQIFFKKPNKFKVKKEGGISLLPKGGVSVNLNSLVPDDQFTVVPAGKSVVNGMQTTVVKLLPLTDKGDIVLTTLYIDEKALVIRKTSITTKENGTYEMELDYGKYLNWGLPDKVAFIFNTKDYKLPKGITFEYEKGKKEPPKVENTKGKVEITYTSYQVNKGIADAVFE
ncbi:MAG TPA: hypothetical protein VFQ73_05730 [Flavisolibacter sp.]|nr:hypothetical protein [Flavisolibacter sp.]